MDTQQPELATPPQIARRYGIGARLVREAIQRGELPAYRLTARGYHRVRMSDFESWLRARRCPPARPAERQHAARVVANVRARETSTP